MSELARLVEKESLLDISQFEQARLPFASSFVCVCVCVYVCVCMPAFFYALPSSNAPPRHRTDTTHHTHLPSRQELACDDDHAVHFKTLCERIADPKVKVRGYVGRSKSDGNPNNALPCLALPLHTPAPASGK